MPPEEIKHCSEVLPPDVLSNLPEKIIDDILVCLPLRDAVRTSILSKKWRCNWCRLPALKLDQALWDTTNSSVPLAFRFTDIVYHLLTLHVGPITQFSLTIANLGNCPKIDNLICFLSRNGIQHLVLQFPESTPYKLPSSFFTCLHMKHMRLHNCLIDPPPAFKVFNQLVSLELCEVTVSSKVLECLISCSPLLEKLMLQISSILDHLQINAPKLKSFDFTGDIKLISLKKVPLLLKLSLVDTVAPSREAGQPDLAKYFESCPTLEHLHLNYYSVQFLAVGSGDIAAKLSSPLCHLKCLCLSNICLDELAELSYIICLMRSSPYLQEIQMQIYDIAADKLMIPVPDDVINEIPASFTDVTLNHLRSVKLEGITGTKSQIELIKLVLAKSPVLVRMLIQTKTANESAESRLSVLAKITKFPRASPKAEVDYT